MMNNSISTNTSLFGSKPVTNSTFPSIGASNLAPATGLFSQNKPVLGSSNTTQNSFSFGNTAPTTTASAFSFNAQPSSFGANQKLAFGSTTSTPAFGSTTSTPAFGSSTSTPAFGSSTSTPAFGAFSNIGFNTPASTTQTFNNQTHITEEELFIESISQPSLCGDERDVIISRWNQLQAMWGQGCGLSSRGKAVYTGDNYLTRFKCVAYNNVPSCDDSEGFVSLLIKRPHTLVLNEKVNIREKIHQIINNQSITISIEDIRPAIKAFTNPIATTQPKASFGFLQAAAPPQANINLTGEALCDVIIKVTEMMPNGPPRQVPSTMLANYLKSEPLKCKLETELSVIDVIPQMCPNTKDINDYLTGPAPRGLDVELWEKAKQQCPNLTNMVPVPVIGMSELKARINGQVEFAQSQLTTIRKEAETISEMKTKVVTMSGKIEQLKRKQVELGNRILKVMCRLEIIKKQGYALSAEEETLKCSLDKLWSQLAGPNGIKNRLQDILSSPNISSSGGKFNTKLSYNSMSGDSMDELKEYFNERQMSIKEMMTLIREDVACLNAIENM